MTITYLFVILLFGFTLGILLMFILYKKFIKSFYIKYELEKNQNELNNYRKELNKYLTDCAELFNTISKDCNKLYEYMSKESKKFLPDNMKKNKKLIWKIAETDQNIEKKNIEAPRDYSDSSYNSK